MKPREPSAETRYFWVFLIFSILFKVGLLLTYPMMYGGDPPGRVLHREEILFAHWLPGLQILIYLLTGLSSNLFVLRFAMIVVSSLAGVALFLFMRSATGTTAALYSSCLFLVSPISVYLSLVPYQEMLFAALAFSGLYLLFNDTSFKRFLLASACLGAASLTRYEGWVLGASLAALFMVSGYPSTRRTAPGSAGTIHKYAFRIVVSIVVFCWAPLALVVIGAYSFPEQNPAIIDPAAIRTAAQYLLFLAEKTSMWSNPVVLIPIGLAAVLEREKLGILVRGGVKARPAKALLISLAGYVLFLLFLVPDVTRQNTRYVFLECTLVSIIAGMSIALFESRMRMRGFLLIAVSSIVASSYVIHQVTAKPDTRTPYEVAQYLSDIMLPGERALVLARIWEDHPDAVPNEFTKIAIQTRLGPESVIPPNRGRHAAGVETFIRENKVRYIVEFANFGDGGNYLKTFRHYLEMKENRFHELRRWIGARLLEIAPGNGEEHSW